jgi:hypothetical protein
MTLDETEHSGIGNDRHLENVMSSHLAERPSPANCYVFGGSEGSNMTRGWVVDGETMQRPQHWMRLIIF